MSDILDLPLTDIIKEKIKRKEKELAELQDQLELLSETNHFRLTKELKKLDNNMKGFSIAKLENSLSKIPEIFDNKPKQEFKFPSQSELREMIFKYLSNTHKLIKTSELVDKYYPNVSKEIRPDLTRRFSVTLNLLRTDEQVFSKHKLGEKGDFYTVHKELIE